MFTGETLAPFPRMTAATTRSAGRQRLQHLLEREAAKLPKDLRTRRAQEQPLTVLLSRFAGDERDFDRRSAGVGLMLLTALAVNEHLRGNIREPLSHATAIAAASATLVSGIGVRAVVALCGRGRHRGNAGATGGENGECHGQALHGRSLAPFHGPAATVWRNCSSSPKPLRCVTELTLHLVPDDSTSSRSSSAHRRAMSTGAQADLRPRLTGGHAPGEPARARQVAERRNGVFDLD